MKIAAITDVHGQLRNLNRTIEIINARADLECVINCGDLGSAQTLDYFKPLRVPHYLAISDIDRGVPGLVAKCRQMKIPCRPMGTMQAHDKRICFAHHKPTPEQLKMCDVFFHGHLHDFRVEKSDGKTVICCGEIYGRQMLPCFVIYDSDTEQITKIDIWDD